MPTRPPTFGQARQARPKDHRQSASRRGYNGAWQKASQAVLDANPLCYLCGQPIDRSETSADRGAVDHDPPHRGDMRAFWERSRWKPCHVRCHNAKTARMDRVGGCFSGQAKR